MNCRLNLRFVQTVLLSWIISAPPILAQNATIPVSLQICQSSSGQIIPLPKKPVFKFKWQDSISGGLWNDITNGPNYQGFNRDTLKILNCPIGFNGRKLRCQIDSNGNGQFDYNTNTCRLIVNPLLGSTGSISGPANVCFGTLGSNFSIPLVPQASQYNWLVSPSATINSGQGTNSIGINFPAVGNYSVSVSVSNSCETKTLGPVSVGYLSAIIAPVIGPSQSPICFNSAPLPLTITSPPSGGGGSFTFQWEVSADAISWTAVAGATSNTYAPPAQTAARYFRLKASSQAGCAPVTSNQILIETLPQVVSGVIQANQSVCNNATPQAISFSSPTTGGNGTFSFQWQSSVDNINWADILAANSLLFQPPALTDTIWYRVKSISQCGNVNSNSVKISVYPAITGGQIQGNQTVCYGSGPGQLGLSTLPQGGNGPFQYQWQISSNGVNFTNITGAALPSYNPGILTDTTWFQAIASNTCGAVTYQSLKISVRAPIASGILQPPAPICFGTTPGAVLFSVQPSGSAPPYDFQWQQSANGLSAWTDIGGATSNSYLPGILTDTIWLRTKVKSNICNQSDTTLPIKIIVYGPLQSGTLQPIPSICQNSIPAPLTFAQLPSGGNPLTYSFQWQSSGNNVNFTNITGATSQIYQPPALSDTTYFRLIVNAGACGSVQTPSAKVVVFPAFLPGSILGKQNICFNTIPALLTVSQNPSGANGNFNLQWQSSQDSTSWQDIPGATGPSYQAGNLSNSYFFRLKVLSAECGFKTTQPIKITVYSQLNPGTIGGNQSICNNSVPASIGFSQLPTGGGNLFSFAWQKTNDLVNWTFIPGADSNQYFSPALIDTTWFRVLVQSKAGCDTLPSNALKVTVFPAFQVGTIGKPDSICKGDSILISSISLPKGGPGIFSYGWEKSTNQINWNPILATSAPFLQTGSLTDTIWFRVRYTAGGGCGSGISNEIKIIVDTLPPQSFLQGPGKVCNQAQNVAYSFPYNSLNDFSFLWSLSAGEFIGPNDTTASQINWDSNPGIAKIKIQIQNRRTTCIRTQEFEIEKSANPAPLPTVIIRKKNSNILVCADSTPGISYEWGFYNKSSGERTILADWNKRYCLLPHSFDTTKYTYLVRTFFANIIPYCEYISTYTGGSGKPAPQTLQGYPNPAKGEFFLYLPNSTSRANIVISDIQGRVLREIQVLNKGEPIKIPLPIYNGILFLNCTCLDDLEGLIQSNIKILSGHE